MADMKTENETERSDFGRGFLYPLALFVAHSMDLSHKIELYERMNKPDRPELFTADRAASLWLNGAGDHLYEFDPEQAPESLRERCVALRDEVLTKRCSMHENDEIGKEGAWRLIREAKALFLEFDLFNGVDVMPAQWD